MELRLAYASAIIRGVNGLTDGLQQRAQSVALSAEQIGLPLWLVDLRHDSAHNDLPSLPCLRVAASTLLNWLGDNYLVPLQNARNECLISAIDSLMKYKSFAKKSAWKDCESITKLFVKSTPQDIGYSAALLFFIHGIDNESENKTCRRGALVPNSLASFPETEDGFLKIQKRYSPLLIHIQKSWPGFFRVIVTELAYALLGLEEEQASDANGAEKITRTIFFFFNWLKYFLSSEWYAAIMPGRRKPIDMKNDNMCLTFIRQNIPLLGIRERCREVFCLTGGTWSGELLSIVESIFKGQILQYQFIAAKQNCTDRKRISEPTNKGDEENTRNTMSLEEMEAMLTSDSDCDTDEATANKLFDSKSVTMTLNESEINSDNEDDSLNAWELCETWEACAIGTLPIR
mmetsp:Transcript_212/g.361  ORF Transcript_212/g.361 Transcript_212/m.361 type:complete len:403 (-) Transcript_212:152-1360(-)